MNEKADIVALAREIASRTLVAGDTFGERHAERLNLQEAIEEAFRSVLASAEAAALERAAKMVELPPVRPALLAAAIRALIPSSHSPAPAGEAEVERLRAALSTAIRVADEAAKEWDAAPEGMKAGKLLLALAGRVKGYRADITEIHAAVASSQAEREGQK